MFQLEVTPWTLEDDIRKLQTLELWVNWLNTIIQSLVLKYIQRYFQAEDVAASLAIMEDLIDRNPWFTMLWNPTQEAFWIQCLSDISTTSAIVKEIIFNDKFQISDTFCSCDLWSWSGILSLAAYISWLRKWATRGGLFLIDKEEVGLEKSMKALESIVTISFDVICILWDITEPETLEKLWESKINSWISETISLQTPRMKIDESRKIVQIHKADREFYDLARIIDPFPEVVQALLNRHATFIDDVRAWKSVFFPDFVNWLYVPKGEKSTLTLKSSDTPDISRFLKQVGSDFNHLQPWNAQNRW